MPAQMLHKLKDRNGAGPWLAVLFVLAAVLACSSASADKCATTLSYGGGTYVGMDASAEQATHNACNKYCRDADPGYDARYRIWLDSPAGRAAGRPSKEEAIFKDKGLLDYVTLTCANECVAKIKAGAWKAETKCD